MYNLFLDDQRVPYSSSKDDKSAFAVTKNSIYYNAQWEIVRSYDQFVDYIMTYGIPDMVSFDFDLTKEEKNGLDSLQWMLAKCREINSRLPKIVFHTTNDEGRRLMEEEVRSSAPTTVVTKID